MCVSVGVAGMRAARLLREAATANPSPEPYYELIHRLDKSIEGLVRHDIADSTILDWAILEAIRPKPPPPEPDLPEELETPPPPVELAMHLEGIVYKRDNSYAFINDISMRVSDQLGGWTVTSIDKDSVTMVNGEGALRVLNIYDTLRERYPSYDAK
jgi:hypothetical protein